MLRQLASCLALLLACCCAHAASFVYLNNQPTSPNPSDQLYYLPPDNGTPNKNILFDDFLVPNSANPFQTPLAITKVTIGMTRSFGAPATTVKAYWTTLTTNTNQPDEPILNGPPAQFGSTISLGPNTVPNDIFQLLTFGDGTTPLFIARPNFTTSPGFGALAIGIQLSSASLLQGWTISTGPGPNIDALWDYDPNFNFPTIFTYPLPLMGTQYMRVEGYSLPERYDPFIPRTRAGEQSSSMRGMIPEPGMAAVCFVLLLLCPPKKRT
jgi:hypothetical protein